MKKRVDLLVYFLFISNFFLAAQVQGNSFKTILLSPDNESFSINKSVYYFEDTSSNLSFEEISMPGSAGSFILSESSNLNFGYTSSAYWIRFHLKNPDPQINDWLLEIDYELLDSIDFFCLDQDSLWSKKQFGDMYPFKQRELDARSFIIPLQLPDTLTRTYYMRVRTLGTMQFPMNVFRLRSGMRTVMLLETYYGIFFGIMLLLIIYNVFIYFSLRDVSYFYYIILILSSTIFLAFVSGHAFQYVFKNSMWWHNKLLPSAIALTEFCMIAFTRSFLNIRKYYAKLDKALICFQILAFVLIFLLFFTKYHFSIQVSVYTAQIYILLSLVSGIISLVKGNRAASLFILAFTLFAFGAMAISFMAIGITGVNMISAHGMELGAMLNGVFLSLALINKYKINKIEKEKADQEIIRMRQKANILLEKQVKERTTEIQEKNAELEKQKEELQVTLENLKQAQDQLIQSEKMAALGGLVAGVAHEINTPVGISVTAASSLTQETGRMAEMYKENKISRTDFKEYLNTANQTAKLILANMDRTATLIQSFKQISVDQSTSQRRKFRLKAYTQDIMRSLSAAFKDRKISLLLEIDDELQLDSFPGDFSQIITNLVLNSLSHGFDKEDEGKIELSARLEKKELILEYSDTGKGIPKENLDRIFEPFFTTNKKLGTGLGMHVVYNLIIHKHKGTIECKSEPGKGTRFKIRIPQAY